MLYISRIVDFQRVGVVDTDDDVETIISVPKLIDIFRAGLIVEGVDIDGIEDEWNASKSRFFKTQFQYVIPYQPMATVQVWQTKLRVVHGIDIRFYKSAISHIGLDFSVIPEGFKLRISDYGKVLWPYAFGVIQSVPHEVTVIVDDKIKLEPRSLRGAVNFGMPLKLDLSELTSDNEALDIYETCIIGDAARSIRELRNLVIDQSERFKIGASCIVVRDGAKAEMPFDITKSVRDAVYARYETRFKEAFKLDFTRIYEDQDVKWYVQWLNSHRPVFDSYATLNKCDSELFMYLNETDIDYLKAQQLYNFSSHIGGDDKFKMQYLQFCRRLVNRFLTLGKAEGWV